MPILRQAPGNPARKTLHARARNRGQRLRIEPLEDRRVLATFTVTNVNDSGPGSLRDAVEQANDLSGADTIDFAANVLGSTVVLESGGIFIEDELTVEGPGASLLTIDGNAQPIGDFGIFYISGVYQPTEVSIGGLTLTNASASAYGSAVHVGSSAASVTLDSCVVTGNHGLTIFAQYGQLTVVDSTVSGNTGISGNATGIIGRDVTTIVNSVIRDNVADRYAGISSFSGDLTIVNSQITGNTATAMFNGGSGAGIAFLDSSYADHHLEIRDSLISYNIAAEHGAGLLARRGTATIDNVNFSNNTANGYGGGIFSEDMSFEISNSAFLFNEAQLGAAIEAENDSAISLTSTNFESNYNTSTERGVLSQNGAGTLDVVDCLFDRNLGGAIGLYGSGDLYLANSGVNANTANRAGGIQLNTSGTAEIANTVISGNQSFTEGGGLLVHNVGFLYVRDTTIQENTSSNGGGIHLEAGEARFFRSRISGNTAYNGGGFGIAGGAAYLVHSVVDGNSADMYGGGVNLTGGFIGPQYSTISGNSAVYGAGVRIDGAAGSMYNSTVSGNTSEAGGAGVRLTNGALLRAFDSTFHSNSSSSVGGALLIISSSAKIQQSTISENHAEAGAAIYHFASGDSNYTEISRSTIAHNTALMKAGGIYSSFSPIIPTLANTILAANAAADEPDAYGTLVADFSLVGVIPQGFSGSNNIVGQAPELYALGDFGGPTLTHALDPSSPAIDSGSSAGGSGGTDQRGGLNPRLVGVQVDIGAFEYNPTPPPDGDFNDDGQYDCLDIDALVAEIAAGTNAPAFDINVDGAVNLDDRDSWLYEAGFENLGPLLEYVLGDANLDGVVDGLDFIRWNNHKFTSDAGWCGGDFNADAITDGLDFIIWNSFKFQSSFDSGSRNELRQSDEKMDEKTDDAIDVDSALVRQSTVRSPSVANSVGLLQSVTHRTSRRSAQRAGFETPSLRTTGDHWLEFERALSGPEDLDYSGD